MPLLLWRRRRLVCIGFDVRTIMPNAFYAPLMMRSSVMITADERIL